MPGPIDALRFVHAAILDEAATLEAGAASATSAEEAGALADRIEYFGNLVNGHTSGEEVGLFPRLVERDERYAETYLFDHVEERKLLAELTALSRACEAGDAAALAPLRRGLVAMNTHARAHIGKENELVLPLVASLFAPDEQAQMVRDILSTFTPEDTALAVPWIIARLDADTAATYVHALSNAMPPPVFDAAKGWIRGGISPAQWDALVERAPVLTAAG